MGNCLKTQLKESVYNDNLQEFGTIKIPVLNSNGVKKSITRLGGYSIEHNITVSITDGSLYNYGNDQSLGDVTNEWIGSSNARQYIANSDTLLRIKDKYNLKALDLSKYTLANNELVSNDIVKAAYYINFSELEYCPYLNYFGGLIEVVGNINKVFNKQSYIEKLTIQCGRVTGEIKQLVSDIITNSELTTGSINDLFVYARTTSLFNASDVNITFDGTRLIMPAPGSLFWESDSKIYITIPTLSLIYCTGYTDEEIAVKTASGGAWEGKNITKY